MTVPCPGTEPRGRPRPVDLLFAAYLAAAGVALVFPHRPPTWPVWAAFHLFGILFALRIGPFGRGLARMGKAFPRASRFTADWYPLLLIPVLYSELAVLNVAVWNGRYFDPLILTAEHAVFGGYPSHDLAARFTWKALSEWLHASYLSYYLLIYGPPLILYSRGRRPAFLKSVFALMLAFFVHYLFFVYFPVQGPRYLFPTPVAASARGPAWALAHRILESGSSRGAAFPSSHVGVSAAQCVNVALYLPAFLSVAAVLTAGLALGAVYGGFHYAVDASTGLLLGLAAAGVAPRLYRRLRGET